MNFTLCKLLALKFDARIFFKNIAFVQLINLYNNFLYYKPFQGITVENAMQKLRDLALNNSYNALGDIRETARILELLQGNMDRDEELLTQNASKNFIETISQLQKINISTLARKEQIEYTARWGNS